MVEGDIFIGDVFVLPDDLFSDEEFVTVSGTSSPGETPRRIYLVGSKREEWWRPTEEKVRKEARRPRPEERSPFLIRH